MKVKVSRPYDGSYLEPWSKELILDILRFDSSSSQCLVWPMWIDIHTMILFYIILQILILWWPTIRNWIAPLWAHSCWDNQGACPQYFTISCADQSINQSIIQSLNQATNQSVNWSVNQSINYSWFQWSQF